LIKIRSSARKISRSLPAPPLTFHRSHCIGMIEWKTIRLKIKRGSGESSIRRSQSGRGRVGHAEHSNRSTVTLSESVSASQFRPQMLIFSSGINQNMCTGTRRLRKCRQDQDQDYFRDDSSRLQNYLGKLHVHHLI
jgi:hypothetical protein